MTLLPWSVAVPLLGAALILTANRLLGRAPADALAALVAAATAVLCALVLRDAHVHGVITYWFGGWHPGNHVGLGIAFAVDDVGSAFALAAALITLAVIVASVGTFDEVGALWPVLILAHLGGVIAFSYTADLFDLVVFYEMTSVDAFALAGYKVARRGSARAALNFGIATSIGSFAILFGLGLLEGKTGELNGAAIGESLARAPAPFLAAVAFGLLATGLLVKAAVPPFHFWFVEAQEAAPSPTGVLFAGVMAEMAVLGLARVWQLTFAHVLSSAGVATVATGWGCAAALAAAVLAVGSADLKRALAFASAAQMGLFFAGMVGAGRDSVTGTLAAATAGGAALAALALWIGDLDARYGRRDDERLRGQGRSVPLTILPAALALLALAGIPPAASAIGRAALHPPLLVVSLLVAGLVAGRFAAALVAIYVRPVRETLAVLPTARGEAFRLVPAALLGLAAAASGFVPWSSFAVAGREFANADTLPRALLHAPVVLVGPLTALPAAPHVALVALAAVALAAAVAPFAGRAQRGPLRRFAHLHRGRTGDEITWLAGGLAALTGALVGLSR